MKLVQYVTQFKVVKSQMAKDIGCDTSTLYNYMNNERQPPLHIAINIEYYTKGKVPIRELLIPRNISNLLEIQEEDEIEEIIELEDLL